MEDTATIWCIMCAIEHEDCSDQAAIFIKNPWALVQDFHSPVFSSLNATVRPEDKCNDIKAGVIISID